MTISRRNFLIAAAAAAVPTVPLVQECYTFPVINTTYGITQVGSSIDDLVLRIKTELDKVAEVAYQEFTKPLTEAQLNERVDEFVQRHHRPVYFTFSDSMTIQRGISA